MWCVALVCGRFVCSLFNDCVSCLCGEASPAPWIHMLDWPQVIATFVGVRLKVWGRHWVQPLNDFFSCPLCWEVGVIGVSLLSSLHTSYLALSYIKWRTSMCLFKGDNIVLCLFRVMIDRVIVCVCVCVFVKLCFSFGKETFLCRWVCQYEQSIFSCREQQKVKHRGI